jgi:hypothetical protein
MPDELFTTILGDDLSPYIFEVTAGTGYAGTWNLDASKAIANAAQGWFFGSVTHEYLAKAPLTLVPDSVSGRTRVYVGHISLTLTPQAFFPCIHYTGALLLRLTPVAATELFDPGVTTAIPASTGGWAMAGAGVWTSSTPASDTIPEIDAATGLPAVSLTGFVFAGGTTEVGVPEAISTLPLADEIVTEEGGFIFCAPEDTGGAATTFPSTTVIEAAGGLAFGGAGVWGQVAAADLPSAVLVPTGGFVLSGSGFALDPAIIPTTTIIVPAGGWKFGGIRMVPVDVTYPTSEDRVLIGSGGWGFCGDEGVWESSLPATTIVVSDGAVFVVGGAGLATTRRPPIAVITGDALGGFVLAGADTAEVYEAWCLSGQAFEPSVFSGFNFNSFAVHGGQAYAAGEDGIYLLDGDHDAGEPIQTGARVGPVNFGGADTKRLRGVAFGQGGKSTRVRVRTDEAEGVFAPDRDDDRVTVSRDLQGSEFTVDILNFEELSHMEIFPLRLARR